MGIESRIEENRRCAQEAVWGAGPRFPVSKTVAFKPRAPGKRLSEKFAPSR